MSLHEQELENLQLTPAPPLVSRNLDDLAVPGIMVEVTPEEAEAMGLVVDDAVSFDDALEANIED